MKVIVLIVGLLVVQQVHTQTDCLSRINHHRTKYGVELITEREDLHDCANRQSQYDRAMGAHKSYKRCGGLGSQGSGGGSTCANVIDAFFNERWRCSGGISVVGAPIATSTQNNLRTCRQACMNNSSCLSFDFDDATKKCRFYDEASLTHAHTVGNTYWLGAPDFTNLPPSTVDTWQSFSMIETDGSNAFPVDGQINSIKYYGSNSNAVDFFVYRFVSDKIYEVVGKLSASSTIVGAENIVTANPAISVQQGDVIGWTWKGTPAFGFTENNQGQIKFRNKQNSGGPLNVGDQWTFDRGPYGRRYHMAVSYIPNVALTVTDSPNYCAAALCNGHCGPVMHGGTREFSWGVYNNHYTLNWRPYARLPSGGNECPSGIGAVKCWTDPNTGVLWAYGVGGEDCHSTCSLAGATPSDLMCDENTPITGGFEQVSNIMSNFENSFNANDSDDFTCTPGSCWDGKTSTQIKIHENNSNCYVPTNTQKYSCESRFGNANCYGQRFNQVCPCKAGCSWAAGPSCAPSVSPSPNSVPSSVPSLGSSSLPTEFPSASPNSSPSSMPSLPPSQTPSAKPIVSNQCQDSKEKFDFGQHINQRHCIFISKDTELRCRKEGVADNCPVTCNTGCTCYDTEEMFFWRGIEVSCEWVGRKKESRCKRFELYAHCPITCGAC